MVRRPIRGTVPPGATAGTARSGRSAALSPQGRNGVERVMWKPAAVVTIVTMTGAMAHAQQQQSPIENLDKTISELAQEGYEIKAAEDLSEEMPKFVLQKADSIIICQINFSDGEENCFQLRSRSR